MSADHIKDTIRDKYGQAALRVVSGAKGGGCCANLYDPTETAGLPEQAVLASLGCGNPTALAELHAGEVVLDLRSGGGIDLLLSAPRVRRSGQGYGLRNNDEIVAAGHQEP